MTQTFLMWRALIVTSVVMAVARGQKDPCNLADQSPRVQQVSLAEGKGAIVCDYITADGPWIVMQRRVSAAVDFNQKWNEYENGFGEFFGNFWLGLKNIEAICPTKSDVTCTLRVDYTHQGTTYYRDYSGFTLAGETDYKLTLTGVLQRGTANDSFYAGVNSGNTRRESNSPVDQKFTTFDDDNDESDSSNCAESLGGGWWWNKCGDANLNGVYDDETSAFKSIRWNEVHDGLSFTELKIKPDKGSVDWTKLNTSAITPAGPGAAIPIPPPPGPAPRPGQGTTEPDGAASQAKTTSGSDDVPSTTESGFLPDVPDVPEEYIPGIVVGAVVGVLLIAAGVYCLCCRRKKSPPTPVAAPKWTPSSPDPRATVSTQIPVGAQSVSYHTGSVMTPVASTAGTW